MRAIKPRHTEYEYETKALEHFNSVAMMAAEGAGTETLDQRRKTVRKAARDFHAIMSSRKPPQSRDEAIRRAVGLLGMMLAAMFPQYALAIKVAGFLWDIFHQGT